MIIRRGKVMYRIGIDLGGTNIAVGIVNEKYEIVHEGSIPTRAERDVDEIVSDMADFCKKLVSDAKMSLSDISAIGMAIPGTVNSATGIVEYANNVHFFNYPMVKRFGEIFGNGNIYIGNDANVAAVGEMVAGSGKGTKSLVLITLGTGVGGGVVIDGKLLTGSFFGGAELGHTVIEYNGRPCTCGRKGCFEAYCSATALINMTREKIESGAETVMNDLVKRDGKISGRTAFNAMRMGDKAAAEVVDTYIGYLAAGVANMINIFQPEMFCIGGGISGEGDYLIKPLKEKVADQIYNFKNGIHTRIAVATLGNKAGIIGAAAICE